MSFTQLLLGDVYVECVAKHMALVILPNTSGFMPSSVHIVFFSSLSFLFYFLIFLSFGAMLSVHVCCVMG